MFKIIATIGIIQVMAILANLIRSKLIAVTLGPAGVGVLSVVDQCVQLVVQFSALSLPFVAIKFLSRAHSKGFDAFQKNYSSILTLLVFLTAGGAAISLSVVIWRPELLGPELLVYAAVLIPALMRVPAMALHGFFGSVLAAARRARTSAMLLLIIAVLLTIATGIGIGLGGVRGFYWGSMVAEYLVAMSALIYLRRTLNLRLFTRGHSIQQEIRENPEIVSFTLILFGASFAQPLAYFVARYAVLSNFGEAEAGLLQAAIALAASLNLVLNPTNGLYLTPMLNRNIAKRDKLRATLEFQRKLMVVIGLLAMPMVLFAEWAVIALFSPAFIEVSRVVFLFVIAQCVMQLAGVYQALIIGLDDLKVYGLSVAVGHLVLGVVSWVLAPRYGLTGVAIGFLISSGVIFLLTLAQLVFRHGLTLPVRLRALLAYGLSALLVAGGLFSQIDDGHTWSVLGKSGFYVLFVMGLLIFSDREERQQLVRHGKILLARADPRRWKNTLGHAYRPISKNPSAEHDPYTELGDTS